jgi:predicted SprT family Zn-dependent metalloprotease
MGKLIDLTGQKFGKWLVIEMAPSKGGKHSSFWKCVCECGYKSSVDSNSLRRGESRSCQGCAVRARFADKRRSAPLTERLEKWERRRAQISKARKAWKERKRLGIGPVPNALKRDNLVDMTGRQVGEWTVTDRVTNSTSNRAYWRCQCSCGREANVEGVSLRRGNSTRCGSCAAKLFWQRRRQARLPEAAE